MHMVPPGYLLEVCAAQCRPTQNFPIAWGALARQTGRPLAGEVEVAPLWVTTALKFRVFVWVLAPGVQKKAIFPC